jgi:hypothetical protein
MKSLLPLLTIAVVSTAQADLRCELPNQAGGKMVMFVSDTTGVGYTYDRDGTSQKFDFILDGDGKKTILIFPNNVMRAFDFRDWDCKESGKKGTKS